MAFWCCFRLQWIPNFRDYHNYTYLSCFDHWLCVLHTLTQMCLVMPWSCITYAHHMHTTYTLDAHTWCTLDAHTCSLVMFGISLMLDICYYMFSTYNMIVWHCLCLFKAFVFVLWTNLVLIKFVFLFLFFCTYFFVFYDCFFADVSIQEISYERK